MLRELRVTNLALVDDLVIEFSRGLTMLTGETGAGKSLIAGSLNLLAGGKGDKSLIRQGEDLAVVEGVFDLGDRPEDRSAFAEAGLRVGSDGLLIMRRELKREGRGRVLINGLLSSLAIFERLGPRLLSIQSQDQQRLLGQSSFARDFLDSAIGLDEELEALRRNLGQFKDLQRELLDRTTEQNFADQQLEMWEFQWRELNEAQLSLEEEEDLKEKLALGRNMRGLMDSATSSIEELVQGDNNARVLLARSIASLEPLTGTSRKLNDLVSLLKDAEALVTEAGSDLERFTDSVNIDPARLDEWEQRQHLYSQLQRKFGRDVEALIILQASLKERIERQKNSQTDISQLKEDLENSRLKMAEAALILRRKRIDSSRVWSLKAEEIIRPLALPELGLEFEVQPLLDPDGDVELEGQTCRISEFGCDRIILKGRTNRGEAWNPVAEVASGGEKSRIFLGLSVLSAGEEVSPLQLYDEIDAGLGMDNAVPVARLLRQLARQGQVLCITHLPTVASMGESHMKVEKSIDEGRTSVTVNPLLGQARVDELARLLGGQQGAGENRDPQVAYARQLLAEGGGL